MRKWKIWLADPPVPQLFFEVISTNFPRAVTTRANATAQYACLADNQLYLFRRYIYHCLCYFLKKVYKATQNLEAMYIASRQNTITIQPLYKWDSEESQMTYLILYPKVGDQRRLRCAVSSEPSLLQTRGMGVDHGSDLNLDLLPPPPVFPLDGCLFTFTSRNTLKNKCKLTPKVVAA